MRRTLRTIARIPCLILAAAGAGCHVDVTRIQINPPLDLESYAALREGESGLGEALTRMGAPDKIEITHRQEERKEYLWYFHEDYIRLGLRLQVPVPGLNLQHNPVEIDGSSETTDAIHLVFDEGGVLEQKSLRLSPATLAASTEAPSDVDDGWSVYLVPRVGIAPLLFGDGGEKDFDDLFEYGSLLGVDVGFLPAPFFMFLVGVNYQHYYGDRFTSGGRRIEIDDLELYQVEIGGRLHFPPSFFTHFWRFEEVKKLFEASDIRTQGGSQFYLKWTLHLTYSEEVEARADRVDTGVYFDQTFGYSTTLGVGYEYRVGRFAAYIEALYQTLSPFEDNPGSPLNTDADSLWSVIFAGGIHFRF